MDRRAFLAGLAGGASLGLAGCTSGGAGGADYDVGMSASAFEPDRIEVPLGETVVWRNTNSRAHTVTAYEAGIPDGADYFASGGYGSEQAARDAFFDSFGGAMSTRDTFEHTFTVPGQYDYFCIPHEQAGMHGSVVVGEG
jgi:plastocyanin